MLINRIQLDKRKLPKIGILASKYYDAEYSVYDHTAGDDYLLSIEKAGGLPIVIPYNCDDALLEEYIDMCSGFVVPGGEDMDPSWYKEEMEEACGKTDFEYDLFELKAIEKILQTKKPILGICRGIQVLNVAFGGTLIQDIASYMNTPIVHKQTIDRFKPIHEVTIEKKSRLYKLLGAKAMVNSLHHQAIKEVGKGLKVVAVSEDGIIEAVEGIDYPLLAVQWHPENFIRAPKDTMLVLFNELVHNAKKVEATK